MLKALSFALLFLVVGTLLVGCSATGPLFQEADLAQRSDQAVLNVYRPDRFVAGGVSYRVLVDNKTVVQLENNGYSRVYLSPGRHVIDIGFWNWAGFIPVIPCFASAIRVELEAGKRTFIKVKPGLFTAGLIEMPQGQALTEIASSRFVSPEID